MTAFLLTLLACGAGSSTDDTASMSHTEMDCRAACDHLYVAPCTLASYDENLPGLRTCYDACGYVDGGEDVGAWTNCVNVNTDWSSADNADCDVNTYETCGADACSGATNQPMTEAPDGCDP